MMLRQRLTVLIPHLLCREPSTREHYRGPPSRSEAVESWLKAHADQLTIEWLPPYCPSLNLIERLWGHLKRTIPADVSRRNTMEFLFSHDDVQGKAALFLWRSYG